MASYVFRPYFSPQISVGIKCLTVRKDRPDHARPGELLGLYQTTSSGPARKIVADRLCLSTEPIEIRFSSLLETPVASIIIAGRVLNRDAIEEFARRDGFAPEHINALAFMDGKTARENMGRFWIENHPDVDVFHGVLIKWSPGG